MEIALARHAAGTANVVPVILRPVDWLSAPFGQLAALPKDGIPVTRWANQDDAFLNVVSGLRSLIDQMDLRGSGSAAAACRGPG